MGFLKKSSAPNELPDLAIGSLGSQKSDVSEKSNVAGAPNAQAVPEKPATQDVAPIEKLKETKEPVAGEDYLEVSHEEAVKVTSQDETKKIVDDHDSIGDKFSKLGFFDQILEDINGELKDVGKLEDWYEKKFSKENVVSNMKGYWEGNKADIIIESFGSEYKRQINDKIRILQELEEDWREIYFRLVKKEEEMKKEERELKEILSEFVNLCKRRKENSKEEK